MDSPIIELKNITKRFDEKTVLDDANLAINANEVTTIIGKSGVGKSVTLKLIMGLLSPDKGTILFNGKPLDEMTSKEKKDWRGNISFMFQSNALFDSLNVFDNIAMPLKERFRLKKSEIKKRVDKIIEVLELEDSKYKYPSQLSGGMQKRVALARALVTSPKVVLFDEPTTGLDPLRKNNVLSMISHNQKHFGFTGVLVSHDVPDVFFISNKVVIIDEGKFLFEGSPLELIKSKQAVVKSFINSTESLLDEILELKAVSEINALCSKVNKPIFIPMLYIKNTGKLSELDTLQSYYIIKHLLDNFKKIVLDNEKVISGKLDDFIFIFLTKLCDYKILKDHINIYTDFLNKDEQCKKLGLSFYIDIFELKVNEKIENLKNKIISIGDENG
jgi:phospholipid/cholesterol/gamma-HCH transport system ATP-binding protein